jgi:hypothetical protein
MINITSDQSILEDKSMNFVDMHHHSTLSDGDRTPEFLAKYFIKKGIGLCIADHNQIKGSIYLSKQKNLFSIPAIEVTSKEAKDILGYFYNTNDLELFWEKEIKKNIRNNALFNLNRTTLSAFEIVDKIKKYNGIPMLAHPFAMKPKTSYQYLFNKNFLRKLEGIELFTFENIKDKQIEFIKGLGKPLTAGSDGHRVISFNILTGSYFFDIDSFLDSILKKNNTIYYKKDNSFKTMYNKLIVFKNNVNIKAPSNG